MGRWCFLVLAFAMSPFATAGAAEFSARLSVLGTLAQARPGDVGAVDGDDETLTADQQSARLMLDGAAGEDEWSLHLKLVRRHLHGYRPDVISAAPFRYRELAQGWFEESSADSATRVGYEVDRAVYKRRFGDITLALGRQPIDWGSGRFWQPLNVFGAFAPTDLDTDYKPGIDAAVLAWYPSAFSSLTTAYVLGPQGNPSLDNSAAVYYRGQVGEVSELSLLAGRVLGNHVFGGAFESAWGGMGWRVEGAHYTLETNREKFLFWIAGIDYQFEDGTLVAAEWYHNGHGADSQGDLPGVWSDPLFGYGLQQQLGERLLGLTLERDISPLLHGGYTLLAAALDDARDRLAGSFLHQLTLTYSLSNESDLLFSVLTASGKGLDDGGVRSEFGHLPSAVTLRLRYYF